MSYIKKIITVTQWELSRFYKPKNEVIGILILVAVSAIIYFGSKYAISYKNPKSQVYILNDEDSLLTDLLSNSFSVYPITKELKDGFIKELQFEKNKILIEKNQNEFNLYAYKNNHEIKTLKNIIDTYYQQTAMSKLGINDEQLAALFSPAPITESYFFKDNSKKRLILAYSFSGLMLLAVLLSFAYQFTGITGEKQLRITEQIVSAITSQVWMDGKILGIALTGICSMITYSIMGALGGIIYFQFSGTPVYYVLTYIHLPSILLFLPFALMGVLIWNAFFAAISSIITDPNNSGKSSLVLIPLLFVLASFLVTRDPDSSFAVFLSWFPLTSASAMPIRWTITDVGIWQLLCSFFLLMLTFYSLRIIAAKIFRVSILLSGKEPSWKEVFRLIKKN